jgi:hypothetical protein
MGLTFNNNKRQRIVKGNPREKLYISINWNTNILAYWRKQNPGSTRFLCNQRNLLDIHRHTINLRLNLETFPTNSNIKHVSNSQKTNTTLTQLENNWDNYRQIIKDKVNVSIKLKYQEDIELETKNLLNLLQQAAKETTPNSDPQRPKITYPTKLRI